MKFSVAWLKFFLVSGTNPHMYRLAQIARACGRVSVGGDPDKRPVNRQQKPAAGGEPANPAKRGTRLKATTDRAFSSLSASKADVPKRLVYLAGRADGGSPFPNEGHSNPKATALRVKVSTALHPTGGPEAMELRGSGLGWRSCCCLRFHHATGRASSSIKPVKMCAVEPAPWGCCDDRSYPRFPPPPTRRGS